MKLEITKIGEPNRIGRIWTDRTIDEVINNFNHKKRIGQAIVGEFYDAESVDANIKYERVSHEVVEIFIENNILYGEIRPFQKLKNTKYVLGLRTYGTMNTDMTVNFYDLIAIDLVDIGFKFLSYERF